MAAALLALSDVSVAHGAYYLEAGAGVDVCEEYKANLNAGQPKIPYRTGRTFSPAFPEFKRASWSYPRDGMRFPADAIVTFFWERDANPAWYLVVNSRTLLEWQGSPKQIALAKRNYFQSIGTEVTGFDQSVSFRIVSIDVDNDGTPEPVVRFAPNTMSQLLLVLRDDFSDIDSVKSRLVLRHEAWGTKSASILVDGSPIPDALHGATYEVFSFRGRTYFDLWWIDDAKEARNGRPKLDRWTLRVFEGAPSGAKEICKVRFEFQ